MSGVEKSVKGATKVKLAPPKSKYVEHILRATTSEAGVAEIFRTLTHRLRDSTWTVAFKSLIVVHLMIKEGAPDMTLKYLAAAPRNRLAINTFTNVQTQGQNIKAYSEYLLSRAYAFEKTKCDYIRAGEGRMKRMTVDKGLLRETEVIQDQVKVLVKCDLLSNDVENEISLTAFRLLTRDLLDLYNIQNEAVMNVLSHYFEMSRPDAERAIRIYKSFCKQTELVVHYLSVARQYEHATRLEIPKLKHAPTSLSTSLQEYLDDKDFEVNRRQYLAEQEARKGGKPFSKSLQAKAQPTSAAKSSTPFDEKSPQPTASAPTKGPAPDLIDFFESIETNQQTMETNPFLIQQQQTSTAFSPTTENMGFAQPQQPMNGFVMNGSQSGSFVQPQQQMQPIQTQFPGTGFGGYGPQQVQQQGVSFGASFSQEPQSYASPPIQQSPAPIQPQSTNPFRQSMIAAGTTSPSPSFDTNFSQQRPTRQGTNPFARSALPTSIPEDGTTQQSAVPLQPLQSQATGTNPFARNPQSNSQATASPLQVQATGSTNPFRQSAFVNQATGAGWQRGPQGTMGGLENLETIPVFPRPGQTNGQGGQQQSPWT